MFWVTWRRSGLSAAMQKTPTTTSESGPSEGIGPCETWEFCMMHTRLGPMVPKSVVGARPTVSARALDSTLAFMEMLAVSPWRSSGAIACLGATGCG
eukprot:11313965-Alexandrium_andersonii.AAC.1